MVAYNRDIPDTPNNPSVDQPKMKTNTNSIDDIIAVDHISFNATNGGTHKQNSYTGFSTGTVIGGVPGSVAYPAAGVADATHAQYYFKNAVNTYPLNYVKAWALVDGVAGGIVSLQSFNVVSATRTGIGDYTIVLTPNCTSSVNYGVIVQIFTASGVNSSLITKTNTTTFRIRTQSGGSNADFGQFTFFVVQV